MFLFMRVYITYCVSEQARTAHVKREPVSCQQEGTYPQRREGAPAFARPFCVCLDLLAAAHGTPGRKKDQKRRRDTREKKKA